MVGIRFAKHACGIIFSALLVCFTLAASANVEPGQEAGSANNKALVTAAFDRWAAGGSGFFNEVLAPDVVWTIEGSGPSAGTYRGRDELMERAVRPLTIRLKTPIRPLSKQIWADGDHIIIRWEGEAIARDAKPYINTYVWIFRMENGRAAEVTAFLDLNVYDDVLRRIPEPKQG